jgi:hypothetical protein
MSSLKLGLPSSKQRDANYGATLGCVIVNADKNDM